MRTSCSARAPLTGLTAMCLAKSMSVRCSRCRRRLRQRSPVAWPIGCGRSSEWCNARALSHIWALVVQVRPALLRLEIAFDVAQRVHDAAQPLAHELIELDGLRERKITPHLYGNLV